MEGDELEGEDGWWEVDGEEEEAEEERRRE